MAAEAAGFTTVAQCEWADYPAAILRKHWPDIPHFKDIHTVTKEDFFEQTGENELTLLSGGFPCQPFSSIGCRRGFTDTRYLWPEMCRLIGELRPHYVLGENVANFINMGIDKTLSDLEKAGYVVWTFVLPACAVGTWHERKRTFIVGVDVSHAPCIRYRDKGCRVKSGHDAQGRIQGNEKEWVQMGGKPVGSGLLFGTGSAGRFADQPGVGGMDDGIPEGMDGKSIWRIEPPGIPRLCKDVKDRGKRLKALGNAVVPAQVYPILKYMADIETGRCMDWCVWKGEA